MKLSSITTQPVWKLTVKISALGLSLVFITYGLVWLILSTLRLFVGGLD
ncbi:MAG: hypothetical protein ABL872_04460 [Lacibacter sp.]